MRLFFRLMPVGLFSSFILFSGNANANNFEFYKNFKIYQMVQIWDVFTTKTMLTKAKNRNDLYIRRGRFGAKGKLIDSLSFKVVFAYDGLGKNELTAATGGANTTAGKGTDGEENKDLYVLDAMGVWKIDSEKINLVFGYFRPQIGRESITTGFRTTSFQKSLNNSDLRKHLIGRSTGRETGLNLGGLILKKDFSFNYNVGIFDTNNVKNTGNQVGKPTVGDGKKWSPVITFRFAFTFGDPEMKKYKIGYKQSYYGKRNGTTIALNYAFQDETDLFKKNKVYSIDILSNYKSIDIKTEYDWLYRKNLSDQEGTDTIWDIKVGYNFRLNNGSLVRPTIMLSKENVDKDLNKDYVSDLSGIASKKELTEISLNWLLNEDKFKLSLSYDWGKTKDKKWSYIGAGLQLIF